MHQYSRTFFMCVSTNTLMWAKDNVCLCRSTIKPKGSFEVLYLYLLDLWCHRAAQLISKPELMSRMSGNLYKPCGSSRTSSISSPKLLRADASLPDSPAMSRQQHPWPSNCCSMKIQFSGWESVFLHRCRAAINPLTFPWRILNKLSISLPHFLIHQDVWCS